MPGWYSWGYNDNVCPPTSTYSAYNVITAEKELHIFQETQHWTFPEQNEMKNTGCSKNYGTSFSFTGFNQINDKQMIGKKVVYLLIPLWCILFSACVNRTAEYPEELQQLHQNVWDHILDEDLDDAHVDLLLETMTDDGQWPGIDYNSQTRGAWSPRTHLSNQLAIARAYQTKGSKYYHKDKVSEKVHLAFNHWIRHDL